MDFENVPIEWENKGATPPDDLKKSGFTAGYKPPAAYHNAMFANAFDCIAELQTVVSGVKNELHTHSNKSVLDMITSTAVSKWNNAATTAYNDIKNEYAELFDAGDHIQYKDGKVYISYLHGNSFHGEFGLQVMGDVLANGAIQSADILGVEALEFCGTSVNADKTITIGYDEIVKLLALIK